MGEGGCRAITATVGENFADLLLVLLFSYNSTLFGSLIC
jgi:hypothetical protein